MDSACIKHEALNSTELYFKITNKEENHHEFQYVNDLNILKEEFNDDPNQSCCAGGLYFTDIANIFKFLDYGIYLREVTLPTDNIDFLMVKDKSGDKWRANMIILGKRRDLCDVDTFNYLIKNGADVHAGNEMALRWGAHNGYLNIVKYLVECDANVHIGNDIALWQSTQNNHLDVVKFLVENRTNIHTKYNAAFCWSAQNGYFGIVEYLIAHTDIHFENDYALRWSAHNGHFDVVKFLVKNGANIHAENDYALRWSANHGHFDIVKFLVDNGANVHADNNCAFRWSTENNHLAICEFLKSKCS